MLHDLTVANSDADFHCVSCAVLAMKMTEWELKSGVHFYSRYRVYHVSKAWYLQTLGESSLLMESLGRILGLRMTCLEAEETWCRRRIQRDFLGDFNVKTQVPQ